MADSNGQDKLEHWVVETCRGLGLQAQDPGGDFFAIGGSSLTAVKLISQAEQEFGEDALPPEDLFERSTLRDIAATIRRNTASMDAAETR